MAYQVKLDNFEGPLDLLLFLIQENEVDIYDIPIALITQQFLEYIELMKLLDLEVGSEYLLMASTLLRIKARMLLPRRLTDEEAEEEDPREELIRRLLEYRQFKEAALILGHHEDSQQNIFFRHPAPVLFDEDDGVEGLNDSQPLDLNLWDLLRAFKTVIDRTGEDILRTISRETVSIEDRMDEILHAIGRRGVFFSALFPETLTRQMMVVTFLALLELLRLRKVHVEQTEALGDIWVCQPVQTPGLVDPDPVGEA